ncbi:Hypothetical protein R9X50_00147700 [Acrodontium crateriforme]|uniref:Uncharacterized protein n=1 Tax=Acrodontium crateriforme TaxID=150365 RepID=A0AAQ3LZ53_9PEZI|nr:Hypothetical protein R9X50_00147700 [Acrodontium crateriforme]
MTGPKTKVNWESAEVWQRVVASLIATGVKIDLRQMAVYFGTTYDTLENRFRKVKKLATVLKDEVDGGERPDLPKGRSNSSTPRKQRTPKKNSLSVVEKSRVSKSTPRKKTIKHKQEVFGDDDNDEDEEEEVEAAFKQEDSEFELASLDISPFELH